MNEKTIFLEPFELSSGGAFDVVHVEDASQLGEQCYSHFHDANEIIIFEKVQGKIIHNNIETSLQDFDIVCTPEFTSHRLALEEGELSLFVISFNSRVLSDLGDSSISRFFSTCAHIRPDMREGDEFMQFARLLLKHNRNPLSQKGFALLNFLIIWLSEQKNLSIEKTDFFNPDLKNASTLEMILNLVQTNKMVELTMNEAALACDLSPSYFSRLFKEVFNCNYSQFAIRNKLYLAARMLSQTDKPIMEISDELRFTNPSHFASKFKKLFNVTPKQYRDDALDLKLHK